VVKAKATVVREKEAKVILGLQVKAKVDAIAARAVIMINHEAFTYDMAHVGVILGHPDSMAPTPRHQRSL
jgi:hypothetical protein